MPKTQLFQFDADDPSAHLNRGPGVRVHVVQDEACPRCGAFWGNPDCDFPNRPKVTDEHGDWWKCYNPDCRIGYYNPDTGGIELRLSDEEEAAERDRIAEQVAELTEGRSWKETQPGVFTLVKD